MLRTTLTHLAARKIRLLTTGVAVVLGVAFMAGTLILTETIGRAFDTLYADVNAGVDAYVRSDETVGDDRSGPRARIDDALVPEVARVPGVAAAEATVQGYAQILDQAGEPIGEAQHGPPAHGASWIRNDALNPFTLAAGRPPERGGEVVIDRATAAAGSLEVGDRTTVLTQHGPAEVEVVGTVRFGEADSPGGSSFALFELATAQELLGAPGEADGIRVAAEADVAAATLADRVAEVVPPSTEVITGEELTAEDQDTVAESLSFFGTFLLAFALISLFVGSFIIHNTFTILVAQRRHETALLRAIGASRRQVLGAVLVEALGVGAAAAAVGVAAGVGVAAALRGLLGAMAVDLPAGGLVVTGGTIATSAITGVVISVAAAVLPARRAARTAPIEALRTMGLPTEGRRRAVVGLTLAGAGVALAAAGLHGGWGVAAVGVGAAIVFLAVAALGPSVAGPVTAVLGVPLARFRGVPGVLARESARRNPRRTSATAAALMVGVGLVATMTVLASSAKASVDRAIADTFTGDIVVDAGSGGLSPALAEDLAALPEVAAVTGIRTSTVEVGGAAERIQGVDASTVGQIFDLGAVDGSLSELGDDEIALSGRVGEEGGIAVGDVVLVRFAETGEQRLRVAAVYEDDQVAGDYLLGLAAYEATVAEQLDAKVFVTAAAGVPLAEAEAAVAAAARPYPQATVQDRDEFREATGQHIDEMLHLVHALLLLAVLIALVGIANTLALSIIERTRELGLLRAVGMSRAQLRASVRWESVLVALLGVALGLAVGTGFGWAIVRALEPEGITAFVVPTGQVSAIAVLGGLAGMGAAVLPARRAARLDVLQAIATS